MTAIAKSIVLFEGKASVLSIASKAVDGVGDLYFNGRVMPAFLTLCDTILPCIFSQHPQVTQYDFLVSLSSTNNCPIGGPSLGLPLGLALLASLHRKTIPPTACFTGEIGAGGTVLPVGGIERKRRGAVFHGFEKLFLPYNQIQLESEVIDQCPVKTLFEAFNLITS